MTTATDFLASNDITGRLTPEQAAEFMQLDQGDSDGGQPSQQAAAPATAAETDQSTGPRSDAGNPSNNESTAAAEPDPAQAVVLAKDGRHTIPYQKLLDARASEQQWRAQAEETQRRLDALQQQAQSRADDGQAPTRVDQMAGAAQAAIDAGADAALFGDFSEEALAKGIQTLVDRQVQAAVGKALQPLQQQQQQSAADAHFSAIFAAHPDAMSIAQSVELDAWVNAQPRYAQPAMRQVLERGAASDVIELFDDFKRATGAPAGPTASPPPTTPKATAAKPGPMVPPSLSGIPGGRIEGTTLAERLENMAPAEMVGALEGMPVSQIENFLNRDS